MKKRVVKILAALLSVMLLAGVICGCAKKDEQKVIKIGLISPLTGDLAESGLNQQLSAKMAVDEINANGGILNGKYMIELISEDDAGTPSSAVTAATKLINHDNVDIIVGALSSTCTMAVMEVTEQNKITQIAPSSTAPAICEKGNQYIFRNAASDNTVVEGLVDYAIKTFGAKRFAMLNDTADYGISGYNAMQLSMTKHPEIELVAHETYTTGDTDFSVQLTKIESTNPDIILIWGDGASAYLSLQQTLKMKMDCEVMAGTSFANPALFTTIGEDAKGLIFGTPFISTNPNPRSQEFVKKFEELAGYAPDKNSAQNYDTFYIIKAAVEKCDSLDSTAIRDAIRSLKDFQGVAGVVNFDERGECNKSINIVRVNGGDASSYEYLT